VAASTVAQVMNNTPLASNVGEGFVAKADVDLGPGGDVVIGLSASAWSNDPGAVSLSLWLDEEPTGAVLGTYASSGAMHLALGHTWVWLRDAPPGQHLLSLVSGATTVTDENDYACMTVWQPGDGVAPRFSEDAPCPSGDPQQLLQANFETTGGQLLVGASASGWVNFTSPDSIVGAGVDLDGGTPVFMQVFANNANQHLSMVPTDLVQTVSARGLHGASIEATGITYTDESDYAHLAVIEWTDPSQAPVVQAQVQNAQTVTNYGDDIMFPLAFQSNGGPLLVKVGVSGFTAVQNTPLQVAIQIDGTTVGYCQIYGNPTLTHMAFVSNALVVPGVAAGGHTVGLVSVNTHTDANDRISLLVMEFPPS
jgi:hypothetical protein